MISWYRDSICVTSGSTPPSPWSVPSGARPGPVHASTSHGAEEPLRVPDAGDQRVHLVTGRVQVERGPGAGLHAQPAVQRPGAMMAGPDRDTQFVQHLADVVRVHAVYLERDRGAPVHWLGRAQETQTVDFRQRG